MAGKQFLLGWPKSPFSFFHRTKDMFFIFTNNFNDLDVLSMSAISRYRLLVGRGPGAAEHLPMHETAPQQRIIWPKYQQYQDISQATFGMFDQSQNLLHTLHKSFIFFPFQLHFYLP